MSTQTIRASAIGIGIDVSKSKLDLAVKLSDSSYQESSFNNDLKGIRALCGYLKRQEAAFAAPLIIESTGDYHLQSALMIKQRKFNVKLLNPIVTKKYQKSSVRNAKTDKIDARRLSDIAVMEQNVPDFSDNLAQIRARKLVSLTAHLEKTRQQLLLSLKRFEETAKVLGLKHSLSHAHRALSEIDEQLKITKQSITELMPEKCGQLADNTIGLSREKLAVIHALIGDKNFTDPDQITAFFGLDVAVRQSGTWKGKSKLSKRGNAYGRKILYQISWGLKTHNPIFKTYYDERRKNKKHYTTILISLARKFLRYYFTYYCKSAVN
jgi:transposase